MVHPLWRLLRRAGLRRERDDADGRRPAPETGMRRLVALLGLLGVAYAVARRFGVDAVPSAGEVRQTAGDALPGDAHEITIREPGEADESAGDEGGDEAAESGESAAGDPSEADLSTEAVEERAADDPHDEPAEPGDMTVDEEIADDVLDEDAESGESASGGESGDGDAAGGETDGDDDR
ncbi:hypothetical protein [Halomicrobium salinisoli]|uniref:hypothetical protein n=1 Tax=Halomicrobium salinisoli TaxID=2878391 RepID=UPI001CEFD932|nr:hypothetical protein [Halomicrobium salinisoli]